MIVTKICLGFGSFDTPNHQILLESNISVTELVEVVIYRKY